LLERTGFGFSGHDSFYNVERDFYNVKHIPKQLDAALSRLEGRTDVRIGKNGARIRGLPNYKADPSLTLLDSDRSLLVGHDEQQREYNHGNQAK
jgi:hypothetical protein